MTTRECQRDGCTDSIGRIDHGGGIRYCSAICENRAIQHAAERVAAASDAPEPGAE